MKSYLSLEISKYIVGHIHMHCALYQYQYYILTSYVSLSFSAIRRSKANEVYTAKILGGYTMHDELCKECDMPMMKCNDLVECVFCQKEEEKKDEQVDMPVTKEEKKDDDSDDIVEAPTRPVKEVRRSLFPMYMYTSLRNT